MMLDAWNPLVFILLAAAALCLGLLWQVLVDSPQNRPPWAFHCFLVAITLWLVAYAWEISSADINAKVLASKVQYWGIAVAPTAWLIYTFYYARAGRWLTPLRRSLLWLEPAAIVALVWSNEHHHLVWQNIELLSLSSNFSTLRMTYGSFFYIHAAYSYGLMIWATVLLVLLLLRSPHLYRRQVLTLLICAIAPWMGNLIYLLSQRLLPFSHGELYVPGPSMLLRLDWTPFGFLVTGFAALWGRWRFRLWDIVPIARDAVIEGMLDGVVVLDRQNRILDLNFAAQTILGLSIGKSIGLSAEKLFAHWPLLQDVLLRSPHQHRLITHQQPVGEINGWFEISLSPLYNQHQQLIGQLIIWRDVSIQKSAELALAHSRDKAEAASQAKSRFLANMSHELRTPLNAIIGYSELLQEDCRLKGYTELLEDLETIRTEGGNLLALINNLLDFSKVEAGKFSIFAETFEIAPFLQELVRIATPLVQAKGNQLQMQLHPSLSTMHSDRTKIRQVLLNLLGNAAKFTHEGLITLAVEPIYPNPDQPEEGWIRFQVQDTGIGMTPEQLPHIFQAFIQADDSISRRYGGTGLGLALSQSFCHMMGGAISVESEPGIGSTFMVDLPIQYR